MRLHAAALVVGIGLFSSCSDPAGSGDGTLRINVTNLATLPSFTELDLHITQVELFYGSAAPANDDCDAPGQTLIVSPPFAVVVDLTKVGDSFVGEFSAPAGFITEVRLVSDSTQGIEQGLTRRAHPSTRCGGGDTSGLFRLLPPPGQSIAVVAGDTTQIEVQLDPTRDITVEGQGGGYGQGGNNSPGCGSGGPCGKPFKLASEYGVHTFVASAAANWRAIMTNTPLPSTGCFKVSYPSTVWQQVACSTAPPAPQAVGNANDFTARTSSSIISTAVGSFDSVTGLTTSESASTGGGSPFTLQLNTNTFFPVLRGLTLCGGAANPSTCMEWQQFVYSDSGQVYMQYWLFNYDQTFCPLGWQPGGPGLSAASCFQNSASTATIAQSPVNLNQMFLFASTKNAMDTVMVSTTGGDLSAVGADAVLELLPSWRDAEFNVVGDGNSSRANFNTGSTIVVRTTIDDGTTNAPLCPRTGTTGETNSLFLVPTPAPTCCTLGGTQPAIVFTESDVPGTTSTCPSCPDAPRILANTIASNGADCNGTSHDYFFGKPNCDTNFQLGECSALLITPANGSTCTAVPAGNCMCKVTVTTPHNCSASAMCAVVVTEQPIAAGSPRIIIDSFEENGADCGGTVHTYTAIGGCGAGFRMGMCDATLVTAGNGSTCQAAPIPGTCNCSVTVTTPADCTKSATCTVIGTEVPTSWPGSCSSLQRF
jgi:hypothetical protein